MNLEQLARESGLAPETFTSEGNDLSMSRIAHFAALIVEECINEITTGKYCRWVDHSQGCCDCTEMADGLRAMIKEGE